MQNYAPIVPDSSGALKAIYIIAFIGLIAYLWYLGINFENFSEDELVQKSYYFVPGFGFAIVGFVTSKNEKSLFYALGGGIASLVLLFIFFEVLWAEL